MHELLHARRLEVVVEEPELRAPLSRAAERLRARDPALRFDAQVVTSSSAGGVPRIVVGTTAGGKSTGAPALAPRLARSIGVEIVPAAGSIGFRYGGFDFPSGHDGLVATFEDPERPGLPITLVIANQDRAAVALAGSLLPGWKPWIRVMRAGEVALSGPLDLDGSPRPPDLVRASGLRLHSRRDLRPISVSLPGVVGEAAGDLQPELLERYGKVCIRARETLVSWCPPGTNIPAAHVRLWSAVDDYVANGDARRLSMFDPVGGSVDALVRTGATDATGAQGDMHDGGAGVARAGAWITLGAPAQPWMLDAAGVDAAWSWWGRDLDAWLAQTSARLARVHDVAPGDVASGDVGAGDIALRDIAPRVLTVEDLVASDACERISTHRVSPLRGALWRFLRETRGPDSVHELWSGTRALELSPELDREFGDWWRARAAPLEAEAGRVRAVARTEALAGFLRGAGTCEPAWDERIGLRRGYGSRAFAAGVESARALGADALLVTTFGCDEPALPARYDDDDALLLGPSEGDVRIWAALADARARGMRTVLSPELLSSASGTWSGRWSRGDEAQWRSFFERYARFVEHHALLAELSGAHVLSLGTGLASISSPPDGRRPNPAELEWKRDGWALVISTARGAFSGALTYAATSVKELEEALFFAHVDLVGYALAPTLEYDDPWDGHDASIEIAVQIDAALAALGRVAEENGKRILLTQVCFSPDLHGAARVLGPTTASRDWQARQFQLFVDRLDLWSRSDRLFGAFAWRWSADDDESSIGAHDPVIATPPVRAAVGALWSGL